MSFFLGLDVSTTATKAVVVDLQGVVRAVGAANYDYETPHALWSEQDPHLWWQGARRAVDEALSIAGADGGDVAAIGLAGQMHGLVTLDASGQVLRPAILWNDQRTEAQCDLIRETLGKDRLIAITGNDALTGFTAPKLLWVRDHEPEVWSRLAHVVLPKDFVRYQLTGGFAVDRADGSGTLLFDLAARDWSEEILNALGIDRGLLPATYEGPAVTGAVTPAAEAATGLRAGTPVVAGGGDQAAAAIGVGSVEPGITSLSLGTSGAVFTTTEGPSIDPEARLHAFCHSVPGRWHVMGVMLSAAGSLRWYRDALAPGTAFGELIEEAAGAPAGSDGLLFLPYLTGERTPHPDPLARGAFVGLTAHHRRAHLTRAILEGVAFGLRDSLELMRSVGLEQPTAVRATGGGIKSVLWRRILADVLGTTIVTSPTSEGAAHGAAILAAVGAGRHATIEEACRDWITTGEPTFPSGERLTYEHAYARYRQLYPALAHTFHNAPAPANRSGGSPRSP